MFAKYQTVGYVKRVALGNDPASEYAPSVLADWVGLLTGTITSVSQLSAYADKTESFIQGAAGNWTVYDADAHPTLTGKTKVLRRLCTDGINYQYMYIGFDVASGDNLNGVIGFMGGWDSTAKKPTTVMTVSCGADAVNAGNSRIIQADTVLNTTNIPINASSPWGRPYGETGRGVWNTYGDAHPVLPYNILVTPALTTFWANPVGNGNGGEFPMGIIAEYNCLDDYNTPAQGITPIVYGAITSPNQYIQPYAPYIKNSVGSKTQPSSCSLCSLMGQGAWVHTSNNLNMYGRDAAGAKTIPVIPIDIVLGVTGGDVYTYAGRMKEVFATMANLQTSDTFTVGADTYVVIPTGAYHTASVSHSPAGKLCAKVQ